MAAYHEAMTEGSLCISQKRGVITLIPKADKDPELLKNWRPITLLNQDYKYLAAAIADRCKDLVPRIVNTDQSGFVSGRYIGTNIVRIENLLEHCKRQGINGILINVDFEKAFDSIEWRFLYQALEYFGFSKKFIGWIQMLYNDIETCLINNGHTSKFFNPSRGVRQGCPLSPTLFVIAIEVLAIYLRNEGCLEGIKSLHNYNYLISQFADDTSIAVMNREGILDEVFKLLNKFTTISGLKINVDKSEVLMLGICTIWDIHPQYRPIVKDSVKVLGIHISKDPLITFNLNYAPVLEKMKNITEIWMKRHLSLAGKIIIIKTMILSKLIYCMTVLPKPPGNYLKDVDTILYKFLSNNKPEKHRRKTLIGDYKEGGFKMTDINTQHQAIKAAWMIRFVNNAGIWREWMLEQIGDLDYRYLLRCNIKLQDLPFKLPLSSIWLDIWTAWCKANYKEELTCVEEICNQTLWFNSQIRIGNKVAFHKRWAEKDIMWMNDILTEGTPYRMLTLEELEGKYKLKIPFTEYYGILKAIPSSWKMILRGTEQEDIEDYKLIDMIDENKSPSKIIYRLLMQEIFEPPHTKVQKWAEHLTLTLHMDEFLRGLERGRTSTINSRLRSFNYNFHMWNVPYERRLYKMGIKASDECQYCKTKETLVHLYWTCPQSRRLWERLKLEIKNHLGVEINLTASQCLLNLNDNNNKAQGATMKSMRILYLICKHYIHLSKCSGEDRNEHGLIGYIIRTYNMEYNIAQSNGSVKLISIKWKKLTRAWTDKQ